MRYLFFLSLFLFLSFCLSAQSTWRKGYVITKDGETLSGEVNDLEWDNVIKEVEFRLLGQPSKIYKATEIKAFGTDRLLRYESHHVKYDGDRQILRAVGPAESKFLPITKEPETWKEEHLFLEVKVDAPIGLLFFREENDRPHYFVKRDSVVEELLNRQYNQGSEGRLSVVTYEKYKQQLLNITNDCPAIQSTLKTLAYSESSLMKVVTKINACKGDEVAEVIPEKREKLPVRFGISLMAFMMNSEAQGYYTSFMTSPNYSIGGFLEVRSKARPHRISWYSEFSYRIVTQQEGYDQNNLALFPKNDYYLESTKIKFLSGIKLGYPTKSGSEYYFTPFLSVQKRMNTSIAKISPYGKLIKYLDGNELGFGLVVGKRFSFLQSRFGFELRLEQEYYGANSWTFTNMGLGLKTYIK